MKPQDAVIHGSILRAILDTARVSPRDEEALLASTGLNRKNLDGEASTIPLSKYLRAFDALAHLQQKPLTGLHLGERMGPALVGAVGYLFLGAPTLRSAIEIFIEGTFSIQGASQLAFADDAMPSLTYSFMADDLGPTRQDCEFSISYLCSLIRQFLGPSFSPQEVHFRHRPAAPISSYESVFHCPVFFEQDHDQMILHPSDLTGSSRGQDVRINSLLQHYLALLGQQRLSSPTASDRVNSILSTWSLTAPPQRQDLASALAISEDKMKRQLKNEGTNFRTLLRQRRIAAAKDLMRDRRVSLLEVAHRVGYSDAAAFTHAFVAMTGLTPRAYRGSLDTKDPT